MFCTNISPFIFIKKIRFISSVDLSALEINAMICSQRAMLASRVRQLTADSNGRLTHFFKTLNFLGRVWQPTAD
jgi:hypothetical protein